MLATASIAAVAEVDLLHSPGGDRVHRHLIHDGPRKFQKTKVACYGNVSWKIKNRGSDWSSTAIAEPNVENRVKIRLVEVGIKWLTEIVKKKKEIR